MTRWLTPLPLLAACAAGEPLPPLDLVEEAKLEQDHTADPTIANGVDILGPDGCDLALSPVPALYDATAAAAALWDEALPGCWVRVEPALGVPVGVVDDLASHFGARGLDFDDDGAVAVAHVGRGVNVPEHWLVRELLVEPGHEWTLVHEIGHALGAFEHIQSGVMAVGTKATEIDELAIAAVCARTPCGLEEGSATAVEPGKEETQP